MSAPPKPLMLIVMDGWGYRENPEHNAIAKARKPTWDYFWQNYPHTLIHASEAAGGVRAHEEHPPAMAELAVKRGAKQLYLHAFLDGRDTPPRSAAASIKATEDKFAALGQGRIASIIGRYYAMDRDHRWPRIQSAYDLITQGKAEHTAKTASEGLELAYAG